MSETAKTKPVLLCDIETYSGFFFVAFKRISDGKVVTFELSDRSTIDRERLRRIMLQHRIVTFNGMSYDMPMIWYALQLLEDMTSDDNPCGLSVADINAKLKSASDRIITARIKYWEIEEVLGISIPRAVDHVDLIEPQPNAWASLKTLNGRLHGKRMQDLPLEPDARLTHADMDDLIDYCVNSDIPATERLYEALKEPLELRAALGAEYGMNFMSKSDAQCGEMIVKRRVEQATGEKVQKVSTPAGTSFPYRVPPYLRFEHPEMAKVIDRLRTTEFFVRSDGKVDLPEWLTGKEVVIGDTTYAMGIGGLHSTEANRSVYSDEDHQLIDFDVASYYPAIIIGSGLYPRSLGPTFLEVYRKIRDDRMIAKRRTQELDREIKKLKQQLAELVASDGQ
jgi:hypothetical protein